MKMLNLKLNLLLILNGFINCKFDDTFNINALVSKSIHHNNTLLEPASSSPSFTFFNKTEEKQYCSFFNNRAPSPQINLRNCTWYRENSCCLQSEIEATFNKVIKFNLLSVSQLWSLVL
jgi:hypothetical protein